MASACLHLSSTPNLRKMLNAALETLGAVPSSQIADRTAAGDSDDQKIAAPTDLTAKFKQYTSTKDGDAIPYAVVRAAWSALREQHRLDRSDRSDRSEASGNRRAVQISPSDSCETSEVSESDAREEASGVSSIRDTAISGNTSNRNTARSEIASSGTASSDKRSDWLLHEVLQGCHVLLPAPPEPPKKSAELEARLADLREAEEQRRYRELVRDVVPKGAKGRGVTGAGGGDDEEDLGGQGGSSYLASYREQLGFGMHVVGVMFTCYLLGHYAASALIKDQPALHPVGGAVGLIFGMLLETTLFIIRTTQLEEKQARQRSKKAARKQGVSVPPLTAGLARTKTADKSASDVSVGSEELDAVRHELIELAGRRQKGAGVPGSSGGSMMRRRNVRQSDGD
ncbi:unnamed protein product [Closterium sp. Yama58-4]|nr:unnamed protein product [Closterium sp. Yama58-4]